MADDEREALQRFFDSLFADSASISRLDVILRAESYDLGDELSSLFELLPPGVYTRGKLADQLNSAIVGHGWSREYGTVE